MGPGESTPRKCSFRSRVSCCSCSWLEQLQTPTFERRNSSRCAVTDSFFGKGDTQLRSALRRSSRLRMFFS